jgi:ubiquinone/menaquinone biosynthesis C-methylase UbiE
MSWFDLPRTPEPEVMEDSGEVEAYSSAAAQAYLSAIDDTFVDHALSLVSGRAVGRAIDIGTGPGQMVIKLARRLPGWHFLGVDRSANMIRQALDGLAAAAPSGALSDLDLAARVEFLVGDANRLPFPDASFDLVLCNSVMHHLKRTARLLAEIGRVAARDGAILLRDLRRPLRFAYPLHVRWYGRHYEGLMYRLYCDSVRSAYTSRELSGLLRASRIRGIQVFRRGQTHLGLERPAR